MCTHPDFSSKSISTGGIHFNAVLIDGEVACHTFDGNVPHGCMSLRYR
jgi:hypothetical protein